MLLCQPYREGFIGGAICTMIFSFFFPALLARWKWFTCPAEDLYIIPFPPPLECIPNAVFTRHINFHLPFINQNITILPIQLHGW